KNCIYELNDVYSLRILVPDKLVLAMGNVRRFHSETESINAFAIRVIVAVIVKLVAPLECMNYSVLSEPGRHTSFGRGGNSEPLCLAVTDFNPAHTLKCWFPANA
ncbi:unnamed protein product, partial [Pocillopora meandrina]